MWLEVDPKIGTVTTDLAAAIRDFKSGNLELRVDRTAILPVCLDKASFIAKALLANLKTWRRSITLSLVVRRGVIGKTCTCRQALAHQSKLISLPFRRLVEMPNF